MDATGATLRIARGRTRPQAAREPRLLVVSHPAVLPVNQEVYRELHGRGWAVELLVPASWRHAYADEAIGPSALPELQRAITPLPVALRGRPQRHFHLARVAHLARARRPDVAFLEAEPFSLIAAQWCGPLRRMQVPFGVQCAENIDRELPRAVRLLRRRTLTRAAFVAARSESAAELVRRWGARGEIGFAPHAVPPWPVAPRFSEPADAPSAAKDAPRDGAARAPFHIGYAGRLVQSKGLEDLVGALRLIRPPLRVTLIGDGDMRERLQEECIAGVQIEIASGIAHEDMAEQYRCLDVLVLPSRTTPTWKEQFGRVVVEALWCGVPVIASDSGELPWLIALTGGGLNFPEGDHRALTGQLERLRNDRALARRLAATGHANAKRRFSVPAAADALEAMLRGALAAQAG